MYDSNDRSNLFNFEPSYVALTLWIISILGITRTGGIIVAVACVFILMNEKESKFLRNHVSQVLALSIVSILGSLVITVIGFPFIFVYLMFIYNLIRIVINTLIFALSLLGALKAYQKQTVSLPFIGFIGDKINETLRPS